MFTVFFFAFWTGISIIWCMADRKSEIAPVFRNAMLVLTGISVVLVGFAQILM